MLKRNKILAPLVIGIAVLGSACNGIPSMQPTPSLTRTHNPAQISTSSPTRTFTQAESLPPQNTPIPFSLLTRSITPNNIYGIGEWARIGSGYIQQLDYLPDGKILAAANRRGVDLYEVASGKVIHINFTEPELRSISISSDGELVATGSWQGSIGIWDAVDGALVRRMDGHTDAVDSLSFSPDGKLLASGSNDKASNNGDVADGVSLRALKGQGTGVKSVSFPPNGKLLASGSDDGGIRGRRDENGNHDAAGRVEMGRRALRIFGRTAADRAVAACRYNSAAACGGPMSGAKPP